MNIQDADQSKRKDKVAYKIFTVLHWPSKELAVSFCLNYGKKIKYLGFRRVDLPDRV